MVQITAQPLTLESMVMYLQDWRNSACAFEALRQNGRVTILTVNGNFNILRRWYGSIKRWAIAVVRPPVPRSEAVINTTLLLGLCLTWSILMNNQEYFHIEKYHITFLDRPSSIHRGLSFLYSFHRWSKQCIQFDFLLISICKHQGNLNCYKIKALQR